MKKKNIKSFWIIFSIISIILFVFVIPIVINWVYSKPAVVPLFAMSWEAKDALAFYGSILGAAVTIGALVVTIRFTVNSQKEERKLAIKPYLQTRQTQLKDLNDEVFQNDVAYIFIRNKKIIVKDVPVDELLDFMILKERHREWNKNGNNTLSFIYAEGHTSLFLDNYVFFLRYYQLWSE